MNILEIELRNPITHSEVDKLVKELQAEKNPEYLIMDYGGHDFETLDALKYCKEQLLKFEDEVLKFQKIAVVHSTEGLNKSADESVLRYFNSVIDARKWFFE